MLGSTSTSGKEERLALIKGTFYATVPAPMDEKYRQLAQSVWGAFQRGDSAKVGRIPLETMRIISRVAQAGLFSGKQFFIQKDSKKIEDKSDPDVQPGLPFCISVIPSKALKRRMDESKEEVVNPKELDKERAEQFYLGYFFHGRSMK